MQRLFVRAAHAYTRAGYALALLAAVRAETIAFPCKTRSKSDGKMWKRREKSLSPCTAPTAAYAAPPGSTVVARTPDSRCRLTFGASVCKRMVSNGS